MFVQVTAKNVGGVFYETQCRRWQNYTVLSANFILCIAWLRKLYQNNVHPNKWTPSNSKNFQFTCKM